MRWKFLVPLLIAGTGVSFAGAWFTYQTTESQLERQLRSRGELLASALNHLAMVATTRFQVQHVVEKVMKDSPEIERIVIFAENDGKVLAASEASWVGQGIEQLPDHVRDHLTEARQDGAPGHHFDADGDKFLFAAPLGAYIGAGDAIPAAGMGHAGADGARPPTRGVILVQLDRRATNLAVSSILWQGFIALLGAVALTMVLAYLLVSEYVLGPLRRIQATMTRRRSGDMTARAPPLKDDEMGDLARTFNDMLDALDDQRAELAGAAEKLGQALQEAEDSNALLQLSVMRLRREIDQRTRAEEGLRAATTQAELANRGKSEFLANMSHELRTPLNSVIGFAKVISEGMFGPVGDAKYVEYADDIATSGEHLLELINDILDLSNIETGKLELYEQLVDVAKTVNACLTLVRERAKEAGIRLETHFDDFLPALEADQRKFKQILINLFSNAVKFTPAGGVVSVHVSVADDGSLVLRISDTGIGIAADDIATAMAPFSQVDGKLNRRYEGTGLGLPLVKGLVELHGGSFELESEVGAGTTATVRFPAERVHDIAA